MVTLRDIAQQCGLSIATVSKAMNGVSEVSAATAQRIRETAREMGYLPNAAARSMKTGRSMSIALLQFPKNCSVWKHSYFAGIADAVQRVVEEKGYDLVPVNRTAAETMGGYLSYCRYRSYDGVLVLSATFSESTLLDLVNSEIPLVTIDYAFHHRAAVLSDNLQGMQELVRFAYARGHRRLAFIHGEDAPVTRDRLASFHAACEALGLRIPPEYVREALYNDPESSARETEALLGMPQIPTCIFYPDDYAYVGGFRALCAHGLSVPEDVSAVGYDGTQIASIYQHPLTTFQQDCDAIGATAARMLLDAIGSPRSFLPRQVVLPGRLVAGETVRDLGAPDAAFGQARRA